MSSELLQEGVSLTIESNPILINRWLADERGSWGALAGKAVIACRQRLGRKLTDAERREVWDLLWSRLTHIKASQKDYSPLAGGE